MIIDADADSPQVYFAFAFAFVIIFNAHTSNERQSFIVGKGSS